VPALLSFLKFVQEKASPVAHHLTSHPVGMSCLHIAIVQSTALEHRSLSIPLRTSSTSLASSSRKWSRPPLRLWQFGTDVRTIPDTNTSATHLVDTPRISVEEHLHTLAQQLLRLVFRQQRPLSVDPRLCLVCFSQQWNGDMGAEAGGKGRSGVCRSEEIDVAEEPGINGLSHHTSRTPTHVSFFCLSKPPTRMAFHSGLTFVRR